MKIFWEIIDDVGGIIISSVDKVRLAIPKRGKRERVEVKKEKLSAPKGMEELFVPKVAKEEK